jgi:hypothetical protein
MSIVSKVQNGHRLYFFAAAQASFWFRGAASLEQRSIAVKSIPASSVRRH